MTGPAPNGIATCRIESSKNSSERAARGQDFSHWHGYVRARLRGAWCERRRTTGSAQADAPPGNGEFLAKCPPTVIAIEACGASHHWARRLEGFGHEVRLIAPRLAKPYVRRGKNDAADAEAMCEAMSCPTRRFVPVKSAEQQAGLMPVGMRERAGAA